MDSSTPSSGDATVRYESNWSTESESDPLYSVVTAVSNVEDADPTALPPLCKCLDPKILDELFSSRSRVPSARLRFKYCGYDVVVDGSGVRVLDSE